MTDEPIDPVFRSLITSDTSPAKSRYYRSQRDTGLVEALDDDECINDDDDDDDDEEEDGQVSPMRVDEEQSVTGDAGSKLAKFAKGEIDFSELTKEIYRGQDEDGDEDESISATLPQRGKRGRRSNLDSTASALLGHAELTFARGLHDDAIKMVLEVIKDRPYAHEPYQAIAYFYEQRAEQESQAENEMKSMKEKALQFYLIGAYLSKSDGDNWYDVARKHNEDEKFETAVHCYEMAAKYLTNKGDILECLKTRAEILESQLKNIPKAILAYTKVLDEMVITNEAQGDYAAKLTRHLASLYFNHGQNVEGIGVFEKYFPRFEQYISSEEVNMYIELLLSEESYTKALIAFSNYCAVEYSIGDNQVSPKPVTQDWIDCNCKNLLAKPLYPSEFPIDFVAKLIVSLINLRALKSVPKLEKSLDEVSLNENGDLFLDIADAYMKMEEFTQAEQWLVKVMSNPDFREKVSVWLRFARCLKNCNKVNEAICAYFSALKLQPNLLEAKYEVCQLLVNQARIQEATHLSEQPFDGAVIIQLLLIRCRLLYSQKMRDVFVQSAKVLLLYDFQLLINENEFMCVIRSSNYKNRMDSLKEVQRDLQKENCPLPAGPVPFVACSRPNFIGEPPKALDLLEIFIKLCDVYWNDKKFDELRQIVFSSYTSVTLSQLDTNLDYIGMMAVYLIKDAKYAYSFFKAVAARMPTNNQLWNLFCPIMARLYQDLRHNRFCIRIFIKNPEYLPLGYFNAHNAHMSGSYKYALGESNTHNSQFTFFHPLTF